MGHFKHKSVLVTVVVVFQMFVSINSQGKNKFAMTVFPRVIVSFEKCPPLKSFLGQKLLIIYTFFPWTFFSLEWEVVCLLLSLKNSKLAFNSTKCSNQPNATIQSLIFAILPSYCRIYAYQVLQIIEWILCLYVSGQIGPFLAVLKILPFCYAFWYANF